MECRRRIDNDGHALVRVSGIIVAEDELESLSVTGDDKPIALSIKDDSESEAGSEVGLDSRTGKAEIDKTLVVALASKMEGPMQCSWHLD